MKPNARSLVRMFGLLCALASVDAARGQESQHVPRDGASGSSPIHAVSGPSTCQNLAIFVVHGDETAPGQQFLTLQEALEQRRVLVHETGNVNELTIENLSNEQVFIQSGDMVRGGKQDRLLATDLIVEARSRKIGVRSFCVEKGRWQARAGESAGSFSGSSNSAPSNALKLAAKQRHVQQGVWSAVKAAQARLSANVRQSVADAASPSSLELSLDNKQVQAKVAEYVKALSACIDTHADAIGVVVAINGRLISADTYGSRALFRKLWPKLLDAAAVEAIASQDAQSTGPVPTSDEAREFLVAAQHAEAKTRSISTRTQWLSREAAQQVRFETLDSKNGGACVHTNCLRTDSAGDASAGSARGPRP